MEADKISKYNSDLMQRISWIGILVDWLGICIGEKYDFYRGLMEATNL